MPVIYEDPHTPRGYRPRPATNIHDSGLAQLALEKAQQAQREVGDPWDLLEAGQSIANWSTRTSQGLLDTYTGLGTLLDAGLSGQLGTPMDIAKLAPKMATEVLHSYERMGTDPIDQLVNHPDEFIFNLLGIAGWATLPTRAAGLASRTANTLKDAALYYGTEAAPSATRGFLGVADDIPPVYSPATSLGSGVPGRPRRDYSAAMWEGMDAAPAKPKAGRPAPAAKPVVSSTPAEPPVTPEELTELVGGEPTTWGQPPRGQDIFSYVEADPNRVYAGRASGKKGEWGNRYRIGYPNPDNPAEIIRDAPMAVQRYKEWLLDKVAEDPEFAARVRTLAGKEVVCYPGHSPCHVQVLSEVASALNSTDPLVRRAIRDGVLIPEVATESHYVNLADVDPRVELDAREAWLRDDADAQFPSEPEVEDLAVRGAGNPLRGYGDIIERATREMPTQAQEDALRARGEPAYMAAREDLPPSYSDKPPKEDTWVLPGLGLRETEAAVRVLGDPDSWLTGELPLSEAEIWNAMIAAPGHDPIKNITPTYKKPVSADELEKAAMGMLDEMPEDTAGLPISAIREALEGKPRWKLDPRGRRMSAGEFEHLPVSSPTARRLIDLMGRTERAAGDEAALAQEALLRELMGAPSGGHGVTPEEMWTEQALSLNRGALSPYDVKEAVADVAEEIRAMRSQLERLHPQDEEAIYLAEQIDELEKFINELESGTPEGLSARYNRKPTGRDVEDAADDWWDEVESTGPYQEERPDPYQRWEDADYERAGRGYEAAKSKLDAKIAKYREVLRSMSPSSTYEEGSKVYTYQDMKDELAKLEARRHLVGLGTQPGPPGSRFDEEPTDLLAQAEGLGRTLPPEERLRLLSELYVAVFEKGEGNLGPYRRLIEDQQYWPTEWMAAKDFDLLEELTRQLEAEVPRGVSRPTIKAAKARGEAPAGGINISSYEQGLGAALTNKTKPGTYPVEFRGTTYPSAEAAYQANKGTNLSDDAVRSLMTEVIEAKLRQYPDLVQQITQAGGEAFLQKATHNLVKDGRVLKQDRWTGENGLFMQSLREAYSRVVGKAEEVFVFGSNTEGRHGAGAALEAKNKHGAVYGQAEGAQGGSYAIVTKDLRAPKGSKYPEEKIVAQIDKFLEYARAHPERTFKVTKLGSGLAGYPEEVARSWWQGKDIPSNVQLPEGWASAKPSRVIFTGSREWKDKAMVQEVVDSLPPNSTLIHGAARGLDSMAAEAARRRPRRDIYVEGYPADWSLYQQTGGKQGRDAGFKRNLQMLERGADQVIAFWDPNSKGGSRGTLGMIVEAEKRGIPVAVKLPAGVTQAQYEAAKAAYIRSTRA